MSAATAKFQLFGNPMSTCTQKCLYALYEKQADSQFDLVSLDFAKGEHKQEAHLKTQPFGKMPAITDGNFTLYESRAIVQYINERFTGKGTELVPDANTAKGRALFQQWQSVETANYNTDLTTIIANRVWNKYRNLPADENAIKGAVEHLQANFPILENQLKGKEYILGNFSAIDIYFAPYLNLFKTLPEYEILTKDKPNISAWVDRVLNRPAYKKALSLIKW